MKRYLLRLVLIAATFDFIFPRIPGIDFHGTFWQALGVGVVFAFLGWVVESLAIALSAILTIGTLGMALLVLIPAWILGFWLLPAVVLRWVADVMPTMLSFSGWLPAIEGGVFMLLIGIATSGDTRKRAIKKSD
jgi:hypothetical protein